jgi:hypothetical protein|uniref:Uncharacterized protein n=1 Tax=Zea mays TaxID=4577 RepID=B4FE56_MAIZE|nr:unknown [Zea mays]|eukprot:NP_001131819.2 uncharacterized protein LOC100193192 [Zea mays]
MHSCSVHILPIAQEEKEIVKQVYSSSIYLQLQVKKTKRRVEEVELMRTMPPNSERQYGISGSPALAEREERPAQPPRRWWANVGGGIAALRFAVTSCCDSLGGAGTLPQNCLQREVEALVGAGVHGQRPAHGQETAVSSSSSPSPHATAAAATVPVRGLMRRHSLLFAGGVCGGRSRTTTNNIYGDVVRGGARERDVEVVVVAAKGGGVGDVGPAERAAGGGLEPGVDAVDVEGVEAGRQHAEPLAVAEVGEAHGARGLLGLRRQHEARTAVAVPERGDPADGRLLHAAPAWWLVVHGDDDVAAVARPGGDVVVVVVHARAPEEEEAAAGEDEVVCQEQERGGEDADDGDGEDHEARAGEGRGRRRRRGRVHVRNWNRSRRGVRRQSGAAVAVPMQLRVG